METKLRELIDLEGLYEFYIDQVKELEVIDIELRVSDFDYTLFSRDEQLENEPWLKENRWDNWPKFIFSKIWMTDFLNKYYKYREIPEDIISKMNPKTDVIISAWIYEFQKAKINLCKQLNGYKTIITKNWEDKIIELIRYVIFELRFIPKKIIVYEDRPQLFIEYKELIENILQTKLEIIYVEMEWNKWYKRLEIIQK